MDVSENSGTPQSSIFIGFSITNHIFWGTPTVGNTHILISNHIKPYLPMMLCTVKHVSSMSHFRSRYHITCIYIYTYMSSWWLFCCSFGNLWLGQGANRTGSVAWVVLFLLTLSMPCRPWPLPSSMKSRPYNFTNFHWQVCSHEDLLYDFGVGHWCIFSKSFVKAGNFRSQEWTHQFDLDLNASILDLKSALATSPEINGMTGPQRQSFQRPPRTAKEKNIGLTINFCKTSLLIGGDNLARPWKNPLLGWGNRQPWELTVVALESLKSICEAAESWKKKHRFQNVIFKIIKIQHQPQNHQNPALSSKSSKATFFVGCCGNPFKKARIFRGFKRGFGTTWYANKNSKRKMPLLLGGGFSIIKLGDWLKKQNMYWRIRWTSPLVKRHNFEATLELFWYLQCQYKLKSRGFPY